MAAVGLEWVQSVGKGLRVGRFKAGRSKKKRSATVECQLNLYLFGVLGALAIFRTCVLQQLSRAGQLEGHAASMLGVLPWELCTWLATHGSERVQRCVCKSITQKHHVFAALTGLPRHALADVLQVLGLVLCLCKALYI